MVELKKYVSKIDKIDMLKNMKDIQGSKGNIDQGDYMVGLYNGLELAIATLEDREPEFVNR